MGWLRFLLAVSVVIAHSGKVFGLRLYPGHTPVMLFFVISGFYMQIISIKYMNGNWNWRDFYASRFIRIFPAYWLVMLLTLLAPLALSIPFDKFGLTQYWVQYGENLTFLAKIYLLLTNFAIFGQEWTLILSVGANADQLLVDPMRGVPMWMFLPVGQAWSLSLELMFYLLIPFSLAIFYFALDSTAGRQPNSSSYCCPICSVNL